MAIFKIPTLTDVLFGILPKDKTVGLQIYTDESKARGEAVQLQVIPQNIQFIQKARISEQVIKDGRAFFFWKKDRFSKSLDLLELRISGITRSLQKEKPLLFGTTEQLIQQSINETSGELSNVLPGVSISSGGEDTPTTKQQHWLRFWRITREPFVTENGINKATISLKTPALPREVKFIGHFPSPIEWEEVADNPFLVSWRLSLIVHQTNPDLDKFFEQAIRIGLEG